MKKMTPGLTTQKHRGSALRMARGKRHAAQRGTERAADGREGDTRPAGRPPRGSAFRPRPRHGGSERPPAHGPRETLGVLRPTEMPPGDPDLGRGRGAGRLCWDTATSLTCQGCRGPSPAPGRAAEADGGWRSAR